VHTVYLSLGSNLGNTYEFLNAAILALFERVGSVHKISPVYQSPALGFDAPDFHNCAISLKTKLSPEALLEQTQAIEKQVGREEKTSQGYESRKIDIDVLLYDNETFKKESLVIPHPRLVERRFVVQPLLDIAPELEIQTTSGAQTLKAISENCPDNSTLVKQPKWLKHPKDSITLTPYNYIAIEGNIGAGKTSLAQMVADEFNAKPIFERYKDNPFLPKFYEEPDRYAFPLEMSFLADRYQQLLDDIGQYDLFKDFLIADYDRYKSLIFAQVTLQEEEYALYKRLHEMMYKDMPKPDLYIYLYQNTERLLENIKSRGRAYEQSIEASYLEKINQGYLDFIKSQHHLNVKIIDISDYDFVKHRSDFIKLIKQF